MIAFRVSDMNSVRCTSAVSRAVKAVDREAVVHVDLATLTVEVESRKASAAQLSAAINRAGYSATTA